MRKLRSSDRLDRLFRSVGAEVGNVVSGHSVGSVGLVGSDRDEINRRALDILSDMFRCGAVDEETKRYFFSSFASERDS